MEDKSFIDYMLLRGYALNNSSLMYGKMGFVLSLFEYSQNCPNELAEKHAFNLLQEVLASSVQNNTFDKGKMGIAWSLMHLIDNQYIEADYQELYGKEHGEVLAFIKQINNDIINTSLNIDAISFLMISKKYLFKSDLDDLLISLIKKISTYFSVTPNNFIEFATFYDLASKAISCCNLYEELINYSRNLVDVIIQSSLNILNDGFICTNISLGTNLLQFSIYHERKDIRKIADEFINCYVSNIILETIDLKEAIAIFYNLNKIQRLNSSTKYEKITTNIYKLLFKRDERFYGLNDLRLDTLKAGIPRVLYMLSLQNKNYDYYGHLIMQQ